MADSKTEIGVEKDADGADVDGRDCTSLFIEMLARVLSKNFRTFTFNDMPARDFSKSFSSLPAFLRFCSAIL